MERNINFQESYTGIFKFGVIIGDILICNVLFYLLCLCGIHYGNSSLLQSNIIISAIYFCCAFNGGVILHKRHVHNFQIILATTRNVAMLAIVGSPLLYWGNFSMPRFAYFVVFLLALCIVLSSYRLLLKLLLHLYRNSKKHLRHTIFVGATENNIAIYHELITYNSYGYSATGYFADEENEAFTALCPYLGKPSEIIEFLKSHSNVSELYCGLSSSRKKEIMPIIKFCENNFVHFFAVPSVSNFVKNQPNLGFIGNVPFFSMHSEPLNQAGNRFLKRTFDVMFSLLVLCTIMPIVTTIVAIITKFTMPGPIFFTQKRNGLNGKEFNCFKFRSMKVNNEENEKATLQGDPRITTWGKILRKTSIDELPQFFNVLRGEMSVVGPRPHMLKQTAQYASIIDNYMVRHWVKPGITGWSQVSGFRGETRELYQMEGRIKNDIWYIENWSFWLDIYIILKTFYKAIIGDKQAI